MKVMVSSLSSLTILLTLLFPASSTASDSSYSVRLRILEQDKPLAGVEVRIVYPNEESTVGTTLILKSDRRGFVKFEVPSTTFWVAVPELSKEVVGKRFDIPKSAGNSVRWDIQPRDWKRHRGESES